MKEKPGVCFSNIGKKPGVSFQKLNLGDFGCTRQRTVIHEFLHALGFHHEQSRHDRDTYVTVHEKRIENGKENQFEKVKRSLYHHDFDYDGRSIMHYRYMDFHEKEATGEDMITISSKVSFIF